MRSISSYVDGHSIAADIRMQRQIHKGSFALLEGSTDLKRFKKVIAEVECCVIVCYGKPNVIEAIELLYEDGFPGALGLVDQDFDVILGKSVTHEGLVCSAFHDFDMDVLCTAALQRYLEEVVDPQKLPPDWSSKSILSGIIEDIRPLSALRYCNVRENLQYKLSDLSIDDFFDGVEVNKNHMIGCVFKNRHTTPDKILDLRKNLEKYEALPLDLHQLTSGHDLCAALGVKLRTHIGHRKVPQTLRSEVELHLRLAVTLNDLSQVGLVQKIADWERVNPPYKILA